MRGSITIAMLPAILTGALAQTPQQQLDGKVVVRPGQPHVLQLHFRDQKAIDERRPTSPVTVPVNDEGKFQVPASQTLPVGFTIATTPACVEMESIQVKFETPDAKELNLLELLKPGNSAAADSSGIPKPGITSDFSTFSLGNLVSYSSMKTYGPGSSLTNAGLGLGYGSMSLSANYDKTLGGVNIGCRNEQKSAGGTK